MLRQIFAKTTVLSTSLKIAPSFECALKLVFLTSELSRCRFNRTFDVHTFKLNMACQM